MSSEQQNPWTTTTYRVPHPLRTMEASADDVATRVQALIAGTDSGVVSVAALRHALTGTPMPDGADETAAIEARIAALLAHRAELREAAREAVARWLGPRVGGNDGRRLAALADELLSLPAVRTWAGEQS